MVSRRAFMLALMVGWTGAVGGFVTPWQYSWSCARAHNAWTTSAGRASVLVNAEATARGGDAVAVTSFVTERGEGSLPLDILLVRRFPELSRRACRRLLQEGSVRVDGKVVRRFEKLGQGRKVQASLPAERQASEASLGFQLRPEALEGGLTVIYEDEHVLAVSKPPGIAVQPCESCPNGTLLHGVLHHLVSQAPDQENSILQGATQGLVHRLDKDTTGVWIYAKSREIAARLTKALQSRSVSKSYLAICYGNPGRNITVEQPIFRKSNGKMAVPSTEDELARAKEATSKVHTLITDGSVSLVKVDIVTGRTHQIRVHLSHMGHPVLGDDTYTNPDAARRNKHYRKLGLKRVQLHAYSLRVRHPATPERLSLIAPLPSDMLSLSRYMIRATEAGEGSAITNDLLAALKEGRPLEGV